MDSYPADLVTPPLALVALLGTPELHAPLKDFLRVHQRPPVNSMTLEDPMGAAKFFGEGTPLTGSSGSCSACLTQAGVRRREEAALGHSLLRWHPQGVRDHSMCHCPCTSWPELMFHACARAG